MYKKRRGQQELLRDFSVIGKLIGYRQITRHRCPYLNFIP